MKLPFSRESWAGLLFEGFSFSPLRQGFNSHPLQEELISLSPSLYGIPIKQNKKERAIPTKSPHDQ